MILPPWREHLLHRQPLVSYAFLCLTVGFPTLKHLNHALSEFPRHGITACEHQVTVMNEYVSLPLHQVQDRGQAWHTGLKCLLGEPSLNMHITMSESERECRSVVSGSLRPHGLYRPRNSPGKNTGVGSLSLLQGIFLTQESNQGFLNCRWILYQLSHKGSP